MKASPSEVYHSLQCRCGSRRTKRVGDTGILRQCQSCGETYAYRFVDGFMVPFAPLTAALLWEQKHEGQPPAPTGVDSTPSSQGERLDSLGKPSGEGGKL